MTTPSASHLVIGIGKVSVLDGQEIRWCLWVGDEATRLFASWDQALDYARMRYRRHQAHERQDQ